MQKENKIFEGACVDTGAPRTVVGIKQAKEYCKYTRKAYRPSRPTHGIAFRFGDQRIRPIGNIEVRFPLSSWSYVDVMVEVVPINIPLLWGLDLQTKFGIIIDTGRDLLYDGSGRKQHSLARKFEHLYVCWDTPILYSMPELQRIHRHFFHPQPDRLASLMKRADPEKFEPKVIEDLTKITKSCDTCQRHASAPNRFRVALPTEKIVFNRSVCLDLMFLSGKPVLHAVDSDTCFSAACFLHGESTDAVWNAFMKIWVSPYLGYPDEVRCDQGPQFRSKRWDDILRMAGISKKLSGVESHNSLGVGEKYHDFLRTIFCKVTATYRYLDKNFALTLSVKAMNDTAGPDGLVPTLLVFGAMPRIPLVPVALPGQVERMKAMEDARAEMSKIMAKSRLRRALKSKVSPATDADISIGEEVLVYKEKPINEWLGPGKVLSIDKKSLKVDLDGNVSTLSIDKVKKYTREQQNSKEKHETGPASATEYLKTSSTPEKEVFKDEKATPFLLESQNTAEIADEFISSLFLPVQLLKEPNCGINMLCSESSEKFQPCKSAEWQLHLTEVLNPSDPRCSTDMFAKAKEHEVKNLEARGTWKVVKRDSVPHGANLLSGKFVLSLKNANSPREKAKARYVAQGFKDLEKPFLVHNTTALRQSSIKLILSVASLLNFRVFTHDITQAYLQSDSPLTREVYLEPTEKDRKLFNLMDNEVLRLLLPLYGMSDAGDYWLVTVDKHAKHDLGMKPMASDPSLYVLQGAVSTEGVMGVYVDDFLLAGLKKLEEITQATLQKFESRERQWDNVEFFGSEIMSRQGQFYNLSQAPHSKKLTVLPLNTTFTSFRSKRSEVAWVTNTRPDICCATNRAAQITERNFDVNAVKELNSAIKRLRDNPNTVLEFPKLLTSSLHLRVYCDASFASNRDFTSQLGFIILLCDKQNNCHVLDFGSKKSRRVVRSVLGGEVYAFAEAFDRAYMLRHDLQRILNQPIPLWMLTDSKQMFDVITKASQTTERRLMIDIVATREAYNNYEISNVGLIATEYNPADGLTKIAHCPALESITHKKRDDIKVRQWIFRSKTN